MESERALNHIDLVCMTGIVNPRSPSCHLEDRSARHHSSNCRTGGGIADPHLPGSDQADALLSRLGRQLDPNLQRLLRLRGTHR